MTPILGFGTILVFFVRAYSMKRQIVRGSAPTNEKPAEEDTEAPVSSSREGEGEEEKSSTGLEAVHELEKNGDLSLAQVEPLAGDSAHGKGVRPITA